MSSLRIRLQDKLATASSDNIMYNKHAVIMSLMISLSLIWFVYFVLVLASVNYLLCSFFSLQLLSLEGHHSIISHYSEDAIWPVKYSVKPSIHPSTDHRGAGKGIVSLENIIQCQTSSYATVSQTCSSDVYCTINTALDIVMVFIR